MPFIFIFILFKIFALKVSVYMSYKYLKIDLITFLQIKCWNIYYHLDRIEYEYIMHINKRQKLPKGQSKKNNPEKHGDQF